MIDGIPKSTGNSYFAKAPATIPSDFASFRAALLAGTLPLDILYNAAGWQVQGTPLSKQNLLSDATAATLGLTGDPTVNDALESISTRAKCAAGEYVGNGLYGLNNKTVINVGFQPKLVIVYMKSFAKLIPNAGGFWGSNFITFPPPKEEWWPAYINSYSNKGYGDLLCYYRFTSTGVEMYSTGSYPTYVPYPSGQFNQASTTYGYVVFG